MEEKERGVIIVVGANHLGHESYLAILASKLVNCTVMSLNEFKKPKQDPFIPIFDPFKITAMEPLVNNHYWDGLTSRARRRKLERELKKSKKKKMD